jgi:hypothetical protein
MKADHPRTIDRYIDFFGDGVGIGRAAAAARMPGGTAAHRPGYRAHRRRLGADGGDHGRTRLFVIRRSRGE